MPGPDATREEIDDLMKYRGVYCKITAHHIECGCFCSNAESEKCGPDNPFDTPGEIVIQTYSNLFHIKCFGDRDNVKKPSFDESPQYDT